MRSMVHAYRSQVAAAANAGCTEIEHGTYATAGAHGRNAEEFLGMADRVGALAPGYEADLIALDGDPIADPTAVRAWCS